MLYNYNWGSIYRKIIDSMSIATKDKLLARDKDYRVTGISHTRDSRIVIECEGLPPNYTGRFHVVYRIRDRNGQLVIVPEGMTDIPDRTAPLPDQIKVGDKLYDIKRGRWKHRSNGKTQLGGLDPEKQEIFVSNVGKKTTERLVLLHELVHAIIEQFCGDTPLDIKDNETFTYGFSRGLYEVIRDNPGVFSDIKPDYEPPKLEITEFEDWFSRGEEREADMP